MRVCVDTSSVNDTECHHYPTICSNNRHCHDDDICTANSNRYAYDA